MMFFPIYLDFALMRDSRLAILGWYCDFPNTEGILCHWRRVPVPAISSENLISFAEVEHCT